MACVTKKTATAISTGIVLGVTALLAGCGSNDPLDVSRSAVLSNPTPELKGLSNRDADIDNQIAITNDSNWRMMWDDLGRVFYTDHPSRLTPNNLTYTNGNPR